MESYTVFLMAQLGVQQEVIDKSAPYDEMWAEASQLAEEYDNTTFSLQDKSEYDCIVDFLKDKREKDKPIVFQRFGFTDVVVPIGVKVNKYHNIGGNVETEISHIGYELGDGTECDEDGNEY